MSKKNMSKSEAAAARAKKAAEKKAERHAAAKGGNGNLHDLIRSVAGLPGSDGPIAIDPGTEKQPGFCEVNKAIVVGLHWRYEGGDYPWLAVSEALLKTALWNFRTHGPEIGGMVETGKIEEAIELLEAEGMDAENVRNLNYAYGKIRLGILLASAGGDVIFF